MDYKGIGQSELAKLSGISRSSIQKLLNGRTEQMSLNNLQSIGIYFHLLTDELLNEDDVDYVKDLIELRKDYKFNNYNELYKLVKKEKTLPKNWEAELFNSENSDKF